MKNDLYRNDISGLRAVAVLLVIFYHVGFNQFSGGFIGVDIFFVLSGFLITTLVYKNLAQGSFTYQEFYVRRVRRLIPVLLVVLAVTCISFWWILLPDDYYRLASSAGTSFLSISNMRPLRECAFIF
jgi:peptidoglycan/LPS O-acetylase OafA/YrhL